MVNRLSKAAASKRQPCPVWYESQQINYCRSGIGFDELRLRVIAASSRRPAGVGGTAATGGDEAGIRDGKRSGWDVVIFCLLRVLPRGDLPRLGKMMRLNLELTKMVIYPNSPGS